MGIVIKYRPKTKIGGGFMKEQVSKYSFIEWVASMDIYLTNTEKDLTLILGMSTQEIKLAREYFKKLTDTYYNSSK